MDYFVPFQLEEGRFVIDAEEGDTNASGEGYLHIARTDYDFLEYRHPKYGNEIRVYHAPENLTMIAAYRADGTLSQVSFTVGDSALTTLVYTDRPNLMSFISVTDIKLPKRILQETGEVSRLFYEYFYDGDAVDFAVLLGTPADMADIRAHYGADTGAVNNSGDYPHEKRIECDNNTFRILLLCAPPEQREAIFRSTVRQLIDGINKKVLPKLNKTADFRVIDSEYD